jgi:hypothetical protein
MRTKWVIVLFAAMGLTATGCSGDKPAAAPSSKAAASVSSSAAAVPVKEACALLSGDAVAKADALGEVAAKPGPEQTAAANGGKAKTCVYSASGKDVGALASTRYEGVKVTSAQMIASIKNGKPGAVEVAGVGEGAVYYVESGKTATLAAAKTVRGVPTLISYSGPAKMTQEMLIPLVKQAVDAS